MAWQRDAKLHAYAATGCDAPSALMVLIQGLEEGERSGLVKGWDKGREQSQGNVTDMAASAAGTDQKCAQVALSAI